MTVLDFFRGALINLFVLLGFVALSVMVRGLADTRKRVVDAWQTGLLFGLMAVVAMFVPVYVESGMIFDSRSAVIGAGALIGGPVAALVSLPLPVLYRLYVGGSGTIPGLIEIVLPALLGSLCFVFFRRRKQRLILSRVIIASIFVGVTSNIIILCFVIAYMPSTLLAVSVMAPVVLIFILNASVTMAFLTYLVLLERRHYQAIAVLADTERRMLHSQKMAAVGQLAQKVAHNFVNVLTGVLGSSQLAKDKSDDPEIVEKLMGDVIEAIGRVSGLIGELLAFSSTGTLQLKRMDMTKCMLGIKRILNETLGAGVEIVINADKPVGKVSLDPDRIEQAIVHMAVNASDAMSGKGRFTVSVEAANLSKKEKDVLQAGVHEKDWHKGEFALLSVQDTGCGMTEDTILRIFEPFFTTKEERDNSGLGLSTVYNIVQQHHGCIDVKSKLGHGTTFLIYLPIIADQVKERS